MSCPQLRAFVWTAIVNNNKKKKTTHAILTYPTALMAKPPWLRFGLCTLHMASNDVLTLVNTAACVCI